MDAVTVQFYKNPDQLHWGFSGVLIGEDDYGLWVGLPEGSPRWKGESAKPPTGEDAVQCFPHDGWWILHYNGPSRGLTHFIDITTPPLITPGRIEMVDLDLDVVVHRDGSVEIVDVDEFEENRVLLGYSEEVIRRAAEETRRVAGLLRRGEEPFFETARDWLEKVATGSFPGP